MTTILERRDTAAIWTSTNPTLHSGQLGVETDTGKIKVGDGTTAWTSLTYSATPVSAFIGTLVDDTSASAARVTLEIDKRTTFSNAAYVVLTTDKVVAQIGTMSASRVVTLPAASAVAAGKEIIVADRSGTVTATNTLVVTAAGSDTINGGTTSTITSAYGERRLISDGVSAWYFDPSILRQGLATAKGDILAATAANAITRVAVGTDGYVLKAASGQSTGVQWAGQSEVFNVAVGDETTAITTGTAKVTFRMPFAMTVTAVRASLATASSSGIPTVDINEAGTTILSTKLTIDASELTSTTAATPPVISDASLADDAEITIDIDVAGTGAKGLKVSIIGTRA